jgi:hypothetical protein
MRDRCRDDRQNIRRALGAVVEPRKEPVLSSEHEPAKLTLSAIVRRLDIPVVEKEDQS